MADELGLEKPMSAVSVVIVDDDPFICEVVAAALSAEGGVEVRCCATASDALAAVRAARPDIVVLDYTMPAGDGLTVLGELRAVLVPMPPVIFLTAREEADVIARLRMEGAGVLAKPFDPGAIAAEILRYRPNSSTRDTRLDAIAAKFRDSLPQTIARIEEESASLEREWRRPIAESLLMRVHKLAGSAGLFKFGDLGRAARAVETAVQAQLDATEKGERADVSRIAGPIVALRAAIKAMREE